MLVQVTVCQAERNVDKEEGERERMKGENETGKRTGHKFYVPEFHLVTKEHFCRLIRNSIKVI